MTESTLVAPDSKLFAVVTAVYNVGRYLGDFIRSIEDQDIDLAQVEIIAVDDGSTDESLEILQEWRTRRPDLVTVVSKPNGGQASARNVGLERVRARWVTFTDPDDMLAPDYLSRVAWSIDKEPDLAMVATNRIIYRDEAGELLEIHPLRAMFAHRDQFRDLDRFPDYFHGSAPAAFFRVALIQQQELRFAERIKPNFEDGHFCQRYLLRTDLRIVAFLKTARYYYRKRLDQSSTLQTGAQLPSRYTVVPRVGFLELLEEGAALNGGRAPEWLQNIIIYELSYFISPEDANAHTLNACRGPVAVEFVGLLREIRRHLDEEIIRGFTVRQLRPEWRQILLYGSIEEPWHSDYLVLHRYDEKKKHVLLSYRYTGAEPDVDIMCRGVPAVRVASKVRNHTYWEHTLMRERLVWVKANGTLRATVDGRLVEIRKNWADLVPTALRPRALMKQMGRAELSGLEGSRAAKLSRADRLLVWVAGTPPMRRVFGDAWVLIDHVNDAGDNAERLFNHLRKRRRGINAWFVVHKDSPDWQRLRQQGYRRLVSYGSPTWKILMLNCQHLISSHIDIPIVRPQQLARLIPRPTWKFTFLQHGVIKDDLSAWLNPKAIDVFITSTPAEYESIAGTGNRYAYTSKEVQRTGLPRFDRLRELASRVDQSEQRTILLTPTWRDWLSNPLAAGQYRRDVSADFMSSDYAENWLGLVRSDRLRELCEEYGLRVGFLPHPNMQAILAGLVLPPHVDALTYKDNDAQELFVRAAVTVTDYSSVVFNSAYVDRPVVYFQFDEERVKGGAHTGRAGYFDYDRDGFGPVTRELGDAERAIEAVVRAGRRTQEPYASRISAAFPDRDGRCCERVTRAISAL